MQAVDDAAIVKREQRATQADFATCTCMMELATLREMERSSKDEIEKMKAIVAQAEAETRAARCERDHALQGEAQMRAEHDRAIASEGEMHRAMLQAIERAQAAEAAQRLAEVHATEAARQWRERRQTPWHQVPRLACGPYDQSQVSGRRTGTW